MVLSSAEIAKINLSKTISLLFLVFLEMLWCQDLGL